MSSSGHLVIARRLIPGVTNPGVLLEVILHAGTLLAILFYFRKRIFNLNPRYLLIIAWATIPAAFLGYFFQDTFESLFESTTVVGVSLLLTGLMNYFVDAASKVKNKLNFKNSIFIGLFQALAIIPGISRSGSTILAGVRQGVERKKAAEFSFLLSVPSVIGANMLQIMKYKGSLNEDLSTYFAGFLAAVVFGYLAIGVVYKFLLARKFKIFSFYCFLLGLAVLAFL